MEACPCGSKADFAACCGLYHAGAAAPTAEALMRSRYSAFVRQNIEYIVDTHDPATRANVDRPAVEKWSRTSVWVGLEVTKRERGEATDDDGVVEFKATYREKLKTLVHHERSRFSKIDGRWYYVDGEAVKPETIRRASNVGRNDPCPCGSGKKFKKCCGA